MRDRYNGKRILLDLQEMRSDGGSGKKDGEALRGRSNQKGELRCHMTSNGKTAGWKMDEKEDGFSSTKQTKKESPAILQEKMLRALLGHALAPNQEDTRIVDLLTKIHGCVAGCLTFLFLLTVGFAIGVTAKLVVLLMAK